MTELALERLRFEAEFRRLAETDSLTGLSNRENFNDALSERCRSTEAMRRGVAVLILDLDRFKMVNDTFGHAAGDALLVGVANRIREQLGHNAPVARLGSDEFAIVLDDVGSSDRALSIAVGLIEALSRPFLNDGRSFEVGATIGVAIAPMDGNSPGVLSRHADLAMHQGKVERRGSAHRFEHSMATRAQSRSTLASELRRAISKGQFEMFYQPQMNLQSGMFDGAEALIRWFHPERGLISPLDFIPLAEEIGLIDSIGAWALHSACETAVSWPAPMRVAVNLSSVQFRDKRLAQTVYNILDSTGLDPQRLELEVTESVLVKDEERTFKTLTQLRDLGVRISLDDFGTGYSSLSYLRRFPFDKIKIDQSFVKQTPNDSGSSAIVRAVVGLGTSLGMSTTAEGVETKAQQDFVLLEGCTQIQGFLIGQPVPKQDLPAAFAPVKKAAAA